MQRVLHEGSYIAASFTDDQTFLQKLSFTNGIYRSSGKLWPTDINQDILQFQKEAMPLTASFTDYQSKLILNM